MKILCLILILFIAQLSAESFNQCLKELDKELDEQEKNLTLGYGNEMLKDKQMTFDTLDIFGIFRMIRGLLNGLTYMLRTMFEGMPSMMFGPPQRPPRPLPQRTSTTSSTTTDQSNDDKAIQNDVILYKILNKMISVYKPFFYSAKKFNTILDKFREKYFMN